jgi:corrinoid protein of di/trimethylamine methyltransferase
MRFHVFNPLAARPDHGTDPPSPERVSAAAGPSGDRDKRRSSGLVSQRFVSNRSGIDMSDELDLNALGDDDLVQQMHDDLYDGLKQEIEQGVRILLDRGWTPYDVLTKALVEGMRIVGEDFRDGILFVPEVLMSANAMKAGMSILRPLLVETGAPKIGKMVIGTVKGDIHDIGKNLVCMMMEGAGFEVVDLGINNAVDRYLAAIEEHQPDILGMSALLTTTMPYMKVVIDTLREKGIRDDYIVLVGGAPLNEDFARQIGADAYCRDAAVAVQTAKDLIARRHNRQAAG